MPLSKDWKKHPGRSIRKGFSNLLHFRHPHPPLTLETTALSSGDPTVTLAPAAMLPLAAPASLASSRTSLSVSNLIKAQISPPASNVAVASPSNTVPSSVPSPALSSVPVETSSPIRRAFRHLDRFLRTYIPAFALTVDFIIKPLLNLLVFLGTASLVRHYFGLVPSSNISSGSLQRSSKEDNSIFAEQQAPLLLRGASVSHPATDPPIVVHPFTSTPHATA